MISTAPSFIKMRFTAVEAGKSENTDSPVVFIIAEAGVNHNGSVETAREMVDIAAQAGADAVKFQTFKAEKVISKFALKAEYQKKSTPGCESQLEMVKKLELDADAHKELMSYCVEKGIIFLSSAFDLESMNLLKELGLAIFKIPSGEITNVPYLLKVGNLKKKIILSSGMATLEEIRQALKVLISAGTPKANITVLHCNTEYPAQFEDVNLSAMLTIKDTLKIKVGYSDHTLGIEVPIAAVALGARVIEKHFTLSRDMEGSDHRASLEPDELRAMVKAIRNIEKALGDGVKRPSPSEIKNKAVVRKSIVAAEDISKGITLTSGMLSIKRPGTGISPEYLNEILGRRVKNNIEEDEVLTWDSLL